MVYSNRRRRFFQIRNDHKAPLKATFAIKSCSAGKTAAFHPVSLVICLFELFSLFHYALPCYCHHIQVLIQSYQENIHEKNTSLTRNHEKNTRQKKHEKNTRQISREGLRWEDYDRIPVVPRSEADDVDVYWVLLCIVLGWRHLGEGPAHIEIR